MSEFEFAKHKDCRFEVVENGGVILSVGDARQTAIMGKSFAFSDVTDFIEFLQGHASTPVKPD